MTEHTMTASEWQLITTYIHELAGIVLEPSQDYLVQSHLKPLLAAYQCRSYRDLCRQARADRSHTIAAHIVDAISVKETFFFRDRAFFDLLAQHLWPAHVQRLRKTSGVPPALRIWSAACSTGQEAYSAAITLMEVQRAPYTFSILGTDISETALIQSRQGYYNKAEITRGLSECQRLRYFDTVGPAWRVKECLRNHVAFQRLNLCDSFIGIGKFDIILCRNVAIYFCQEDRLQLFSRLQHHLYPHGVLVLGATESFPELSTWYVPRICHHATFYHLR